MVAQHRDRAGMQIARARIIAEPGPHPQHVILRGAAERGDIRPARQKLLEIRPDRFDAGLLQHDFRQPDPVRISPLARRRPPRQPAAMAVVPVEQQRGAEALGVRLSVATLIVAGLWRLRKKSSKGTSVYRKSQSLRRPSRLTRAFTMIERKRTRSDSKTPIANESLMRAAKKRALPRRRYDASHASLQNSCL